MVGGGKSAVAGERLGGVHFCDGHLESDGDVVAVSMTMRMLKRGCCQRSPWR